MATLSGLDATSEDKLPRFLNKAPPPVNYHAVGLGPANAPQKTPPEEAAAAMAFKLNTEIAKKPDQDGAKDDRADNNKPRERHEADAARERPIAKRQNSISESIFEEDLVDPAPEQG